MYQHCNVVFGEYHSCKQYSEQKQHRIEQKHCHVAITVVNITQNKNNSAMLMQQSTPIHLTYRAPIEQGMEGVVLDRGMLQEAVQLTISAPKPGSNNQNYS